MKKRILAFLVCVMMIMQIPCVFAYEYTPFVGDGVVRSTPVTVVLEAEQDNGGSTEYVPVENISDATRVTASCKVKPGSEFDGTDVKVSLLVVAYSQKCLADYSVSDTVTFTASSTGMAELTATLELDGLNADGIKVFLWDTVNNARPLINMGEFGSTDKSIDGIIVGDELVELDDTNTGSVVVNAGYVTWPDIVVLTNDVTTDVTVDVTGVFPLSKPNHGMLAANTRVSGESKTGVVTVKVGDSEYTVNVTQEIPQITDVEFRKYSDIADKVTDVTYYSDAQVRVQYDVQNPEWTEELPGPNVEDTTQSVTLYHEGLEELEGASFAYSDTRGASSGQNAMILCNIHPELIGSQFIATPWNATTNANTSIKDAYKFTIDRSCRVYYQFKAGSSKLDSSWTRMYNYMHSTTGSLCQRIYYEFRCSTTGNSLQISTGNSVFYKDYEVEPGETCEITLPVDTAAPKIFVKYKNNDFVTNATYTNTTTNKINSTATVAHPFLINENLTIAEGRLNTLAAADYAVNKFYKDKGNLLFGTNVFEGDTYSQYCVMDIPDEVVGATALVMPMMMNGTTKIEFDIDSSARVYVFTNIAGKLEEFKKLLGDTWTNTAFEYDDVTLDENDAAISTRGSGKLNYLFNSSSFYKDFIVEPEEGGHVSIPFPAGMGSAFRVVVMVKPLEK